MNSSKASTEDPPSPIIVADVRVGGRGKGSQRPAFAVIPLTAKLLGRVESLPEQTKVAVAKVLLEHAEAAGQAGAEHDSQDAQDSSRAERPRG